MFILAPNQVIEKYPYTIGDLQRDNPNTSFPRNLSEEMLSSWNVFPVKYCPSPEFNEITENCNQINPTLENGEWVMTWEITSASSEEIAERLERKSIEVRQYRNQYLSDSDWVVTRAKETGTNIPTAWKNYRQALRDITSQEGFPHEVVWPTKPV
jgi:hypothetical protein